MAGEPRRRPSRDLGRSRVSRHPGDDDLPVPLPRRAPPPRRPRRRAPARPPRRRGARSAPTAPGRPGLPVRRRLAGRQPRRGRAALPAGRRRRPRRHDLRRRPGLARRPGLRARRARSVREVGAAGHRAGPVQRRSARSRSAADGTLFVADGTNRIDRFAPTARSSTPSAPAAATTGEFRFGAGGGNAPGAGGGLAVGAVSSTSPTPATTGSCASRLDGARPRIVPPGILDVPQGLTVRGTRLTVADDRNHRARRLRHRRADARRRSAPARRQPGPADHPVRRRLRPAGRLFVADDLNHRVVRFSAPPRYPYKGRWGSYGTAPGQLAYPRGIAVGAQGQSTSPNTGNDRVDVFDRGGNLQGSFGARAARPASSTRRWASRPTRAGSAP